MNSDLQRASLENIATILKAAGSDLNHIIKATIYLTSMENFAPMNEVYAEVEHFEFGLLNDTETCSFIFPSFLKQARCLLERASVLPLFRWEPISRWNA